MKKILISFVLISLLSISSAWADIKLNFNQQKKNEIVRMLVKAGLDREESREFVYDKRAEMYPSLFKSYTGGGYDFWDPSYGIFTDESINRGLIVINDNFEVLLKIYQKYGVPKELLIAIFRVETNLGRHTGKYVVANSLLTWITSGTRRKKWAERELVSYLTLCKRNEHDPYSISGSTHAAFGLVQFIPSSFLTYAVSFEGNGKIDLFTFNDAMSSCANYLSIFKNSGKSKNEQKCWYNAVYAYNHDKEYVKAVLQYSNEMKKWRW